jgi:hypothetical protein
MVANIVAIRRLLIVWKVDFVFEACEGAHYIIPTFVSVGARLFE